MAARRNPGSGRKKKDAPASPMPSEVVADPVPRAGRIEPGDGTVQGAVMALVDVEAVVAGFKGVIRSVPIDTSRLLTLGAEHPVWSDPEHVIRYVANCEGAFVRVAPPATATDEAVAAVERVLLETMGAARVVVLPRRSDRVVVPRRLAVQRSQRELVVALVDGLTVPETPEIRQLCGDIMDGQGL